MRIKSEVLLEEFLSKQQPSNAKRLVFNGVEGYDVYNPTAVFKYEGSNLIIARVEKRDSEVSKSIFFEEVNGEFYIKEDIPSLDLQDPFITRINNEWIVGGTFVYFIDEKAFWYTKFYKGSNLKELTPFFDSPLGMKDVRLIELKDKKVGLFTRPQGIKGGRGEIGFTVINSLEDLTKELVEDAPLLEQFDKEEWGGANELHLLDNGDVLVLGHIASYSTGSVRHYYSMVFTINPTTRAYTPIKIIAIRDNFLPGETKREDLKDVLFSGGLLFDNNKVTLYVGVSDCEIQSIEINDLLN